MSGNFVSFCFGVASVLSLVLLYPVNPWLAYGVGILVAFVAAAWDVKHN